MVRVTLITRPRRFGKTLNMSMMASFFDITKDSRELFKDTAIMKSEHASATDQYPTNPLSMAYANGIDEGIQQLGTAVEEVRPICVCIRTDG